MKRLAYLFALLIAFTLPALAHKISAFVDVDDGQVNLVSYFSDGTPVKNGEVKVYDQSGKLVLEGKTNQNGEFDFKLKPGEYKAVVIAELGHRTQVSFSVGGEKGAPTKESKESGKKREVKTAELKTPTSEKELRRVIRQELEPIRRELLKIEEKQSSISLSDVVGGLGWIVGIFGAYAFGLSRRRGDREN
ncbi:DUF1416 domain-containing protein [Thermovibrio sp.]